VRVRGGHNGCASGVLAWDHGLLDSERCLGRPHRTGVSTRRSPTAAKSRDKSAPTARSSPNCNIAPGVVPHDVALPDRVVVSGSEDRPPACQVGSPNRADVVAQGGRAARAATRVAIEVLLRSWPLRADALIELQNNLQAAEMRHADWLGPLVDREVTYRDNRRLTRLLSAAMLGRPPPSRTSTIVHCAASTTLSPRHPPPANGRRSTTTSA
jgi:hypothetical protein